MTIDRRLIACFFQYFFLVAGNALSYRVISIGALAAIVRQILSIVAKNENSTEHFVNLLKNTLCKLIQADFFKYVYLSSITLKISLPLPEPI